MVSWTTTVIVRMDKFQSLLPNEMGGRIDATSEFLDITED